MKRFFSRLLAMRAKPPVVATPAAQAPEDLRISPRLPVLKSLRAESETWKTVVEYAEERIAALRAKNDDAKLTEAQTTLIRGEIRGLKKLLALPKTLEDERKAALEQRDAPSEDDAD